MTTILSVISLHQKKKEYKSLDEVDPELLKTFDKLGISLEEQKRLTGTAVDFVMDSVSVATSFKDKLNELGIIFCSFSEAVKEHPELVKKYRVESPRQFAEGGTVMNKQMHK